MRPPSQREGVRGGRLGLPSRAMHTEDFDFQLPEHLIAQAPASVRSGSRLLHLPAGEEMPVDRRFEDLVSLLRSGDLLVLNDTRVVKARLQGRKESGGRLEVLVERPLGERGLLAQIKASRAPRPGTGVLLGDDVPAQVVARHGDLFELRLPAGVDLDRLLEEHGALPLPPYITRPPHEADAGRYQTVYARSPGAVAAPTAGLHFDDPLLLRLECAGVRRTALTLHVGAGTFTPVRSRDLAAHVMHPERVAISDDLCRAVAETRAVGGRVVAVGTTCVRALESAARNGELAPFRGDTRLFITPGFRFQVVDALISNFHLPRSTLLMLVSAFAGRERVLNAYRHAVDSGYRFFSYGDATLLEPLHPGRENGP